MRILHSGSAAQEDKGFYTPWFLGSLCLCVLLRATKYPNAEYLGFSDIRNRRFGSGQMPHLPGQKRLCLPHFEKYSFRPQLLLERGPSFGELGRPIILPNGEA